MSYTNYFEDFESYLYALLFASSGILLIYLSKRYLRRIKTTREFNVPDGDPILKLLKLADAVTSGNKEMSNNQKFTEIKPEYWPALAKFLEEKGGFENHVWYLKFWIANAEEQEREKARKKSAEDSHFIPPPAATPQIHRHLNRHPTVKRLSHSIITIT